MLINPAIPLTPADPHAKFDQIVSLIYEAALDSAKWRDVVGALSNALGGHVVSIWLRWPTGSSERLEGYTSDEETIQKELFAKQWQQGLPFGNKIADSGATRESVDRFVDFEALFPDSNIEHTSYYREWLAPRGLLPLCPIVHVFANDGVEPLGVITIHRHAKRAPLEEDHIAFANLFGPHLSRAHHTLDLMRSMQREKDVFHEVLDRIPTGMVLLDEEGQVVSMNEAARYSIDSGEGLSIESGRPVAEDPDENRWLQRAIDQARTPEMRARFANERIFEARHATGTREAPMFVTPLISPASESSLPDTAALIFIGGSRLAQISAVNLLNKLYGLTKAEAELTWLLVDGHSLEEAAERRGVTLNTTRSQLKRVFAKTGAKRQADLVRIVLGGAGAMRSPH